MRIYSVWLLVVTIMMSEHEEHIDGLVQDCSNSSALAMELLQSRTKPSMYLIHKFVLKAESERAENKWNIWTIELTALSLETLCVEGCQSEHLI